MLLKVIGLPKGKKFVPHARFDGRFICYPSPVQLGETIEVSQDFGLALMREFPKNLTLVIDENIQQEKPVASRLPSRSSKNVEGVTTEELRSRIAQVEKKRSEMMEI